MAGLGGGYTGASAGAGAGIGRVTAPTKKPFGGVYQPNRQTQINLQPPGQAGQPWQAPTQQPYAQPPPQQAPQIPTQTRTPSARTQGTPSSTRDMLGYGRGLMDPNSEYSQRMQESLTGRIGQETEAQRRLAGFDAAQAGGGVGGSPQLQAALADIGVGGEEALGESMGQLMLQSPQVGLGAMGQAQAGQMGMEGLDVQTRLGFGGMDVQRDLANMQAQQQQQQNEMQSWYQGQGFDIQRQQMADQEAWRKYQAEMDQYNLQMQ